MSLLEKLGWKRKKDGQEGPTVHVERFTIEGKVERFNNEREARVEPYKSLMYHLDKLALACSPGTAAACDFEERLEKYVKEKDNSEIDHHDSCQKHTRTYLLPSVNGHASLMINPHIVGQSLQADVELRYVGVRPVYLNRIFDDIGHCAPGTVRFATNTVKDVLDERWGIFSLPGMAGMSYQKAE